jgi:peptide deformylase
MAIKKIRIFGDPVLREKASEVKEIDDKIVNLITDLTDTMRNASGAGLAANQIGVLKRVAVIDIGEGLIKLINPKIIKKKGKQKEIEGCLSFYSLNCPINRAEKVTVITKNSEGEKVKIEAEGLLARAIQHEIDHLNGILIIDHASNEEKRKIVMELNKLKVQYGEEKF